MPIAQNSSVGRYWQIYRTFFVSSLTRELEFKANFFAKVFQNVVWIVFFLMMLLVIYRNTDTVAGWRRGDSFILVATVFFIEAIISAFFLSLMEIPQHVRMGTLDFVITKPVDTQFWISTRKFNFAQAGTLISGIAMVALGVWQSELAPSALQWLGYLALTLSATVIFYGFYLMLMTTGIWLVRVDNLWVLGESVMQIARFPVDIFGSGIQRLFTFFLPMAFLATIPARQLVLGFDGRMVALGAAWAVAFFFGARLFWRFALRHYTSASS